MKSTVDQKKPTAGAVAVSSRFDQFINNKDASEHQPSFQKISSTNDRFGTGNSNSSCSQTKEKRKKASNSKKTKSYWNTKSNNSKKNNTADVASIIQQQNEQNQYQSQ